MSFLSTDELQTLGLAGFGENVRISRKASIHNPAGLHVGSNVRIDDFCVISAGTEGIDIGSFVHVAVFSALIGAARITVHDFANLSSRVSVYSSNDDYSGRTLTNPTVPREYTGVEHSPVTIGRHVIIGSGCVVLPGVHIADGAAVGSLSLVREDCQAFGIYAGVPARRIGDRKRALLKLEQAMLGGARPPA